MRDVKDILQTKITPPPLRSDLVPRARILELLERVLSVSDALLRLVLVSAPAGYGKTTQVREWIVRRQGRTAWYTIDSSGNDPGCFWGYLIYALQKLNRDLGKGTLAMLRSSSPFLQYYTDSRELLTPLLNDLFHLDSPLYLVLDDYHLVENPKIHEGMIYLIENMPPQLVLVVGTRTDPPWPLARWRGKEGLMEIRQSDLTFTKEEAAAYLEGRVGSLDEFIFDDLYRKTEGWITALQLAANSLRSKSYSGRFFPNISGDHGQILAYLTEEVLSEQPPSMQEFLLKTSHLSCFCPSLCNAVTGRENSQEMIIRLAKDNLFIIPVDDQGNWFRYHPLFAELLNNLLQSRYLAEIPQLHEKAGNWFLKADVPAAALKHFMRAKEYALAAQIMVRSFELLLEGEGITQCLAWLNCLVREKKMDSRLLAYHALVSLLLGKPDDVRVSLELAGRLEQGDDYTRGLLAVVRTSQHIFSGNLPAGLKHAEAALRLLPGDAYFWRISAAIVYGDVKVFSGDLEGANAAFKDAYRWSRQHGNFLITVSAAMNILKVLWLKGELPEARRFTEEILRLAKDEEFSRLPRLGVIWLFLGEFLREEGNLDEAKRCITRGISMCESEKMLAGISYVFQGMVCFSRGEYKEALKHLRQLERMERETGQPEIVKNLHLAWKARLLLEQGEVLAAREVMNNVSPDNMDTIFFPGGVQVTFSRMLLAENRLAEASRVLENILVRHCGASRSLMINTLLLQAFLKEKMGEVEGAKECLVRALNLGKSGGFYQTFLDEGRGMARLFSRLCTGSGHFGDEPGMDAYVQRICQGLKLDATLGDIGESDVAKSGFHDLVEELSSRELEILALIGQGLSNKDISRELFLSVRTVKWHNSNIFGKLGVSNRTQALVRARELDLLP